MWVPPEITSTVCFLCVQHGETILYGGTAFFISFKEEKFPELKWIYLVTAKHSVHKAFDGYGNLSCRVNGQGTGVRFLSLPYPSDKWVFSDDADVAVLPFEFDKELEIQDLSSQMFLTDEVSRQERIGLGDEIFLIGLFKEVLGRKRNFPVMRSGIIASLLDEPLQDKDTGTDYRAFLIEIRSIGGLSGSPVFMVVKRRTEMRPAPRGFHPMIHSMYVVGLVRGHWDLVQRDVLTDFGTGEAERMNMGIAIVTPIQEVQKLLVGDELKERRKADIRQHQRENPSALESGQS